MDRDDALAAHKVQAEPVVLGAVIGDGVEVGNHAALHLVAGMDFVGGEWAEAFVARLHMSGGDRLVILKHTGRTGARSPAEVVDEIHDVRAEHPKIFTAPAPIAFAAGANLQQLAQLALGDELVDHRKHWMPAVTMGNGDLRAVFFAGGAE